MAVQLACHQSENVQKKLLTSEGWEREVKKVKNLCVFAFRAYGVVRRSLLEVRPTLRRCWWQRLCWLVMYESSEERSDLLYSLVHLWLKGNSPTYYLGFLFMARRAKKENKPPKTLLPNSCLVEFSRERLNCQWLPLGPWVKIIPSILVFVFMKLSL